MKKLSKTDCIFYLSSTDPDWRNLSFTEQNRRIAWHMQKEKGKK